MATPKAMLKKVGGFQSPLHSFPNETAHEFARRAALDQGILVSGSLITIWKCAGCGTFYFSERSMYECPNSSRCQGGSGIIILTSDLLREMDIERAKESNPKSNLVQIPLF